MDKEEKLCIKILQTLREMLDKKEAFDEPVSTDPDMVRQEFVYIQGLFGIGMWRTSI